MLYTIENEKLIVEISDVGAEMMSIRTKADGCEYLWQGDAKYWGDRAIVLFPICGRLVDGYYTYEGKKYEMGLHGFAQKMPMAVTEKSEQAVTFSLQANEETKKMYPFDFTFRVSYALQGNRIAVTFDVTNNGSGDMPYSVGGHPGFRVPLGDAGRFEDCYLDFGEKCAPEMFLLSPTCFLSGETAPFKLRCGKRLDLRHDLFDNDAIFLKEAAKSVSIKSRACKKSVTVEYPSMDYVGFWHADHTDAPFVCIEPWNGLPGTDGHVDDFSDKHAMRHLAGGQSETSGFSILIQ